ncbi:TPA: hypothetical protein N0F65_012342 [Lagenidium giganteum]|uniref:Uncharacterized protein n=1 Tax=Lagenidium giganteum TaxID=4803 RepID=A0AAV2YRN1_9STRA|nr:TPA: hypothetical protein N0F65_012342 [Lagenidium giganteum]
MTGVWRDAIGDTGMMFEDVADGPRAMPRAPMSPIPRSPEPKVVCVARKASQVVTGGSRSRRGCVVCRFEGRHPTESTDFCMTHNVCLCKKQYGVGLVMPSHLCQETEWTCWQKFHDYYFPKQLFNNAGRIRRGSALFKANKAYQESAEIESSTSFVFEF